ncbi:YifB family Mg chelatase-like AAA ATPase [Brevibacillus sp. SYSU BS000544]|uniref:YifB family Mg chelatase-like AAA ATPase n=1 Tax=Brevibacillus sp. SYSU BS000544 TaxID=3416443 RepID=UPI003CE56DF1
MYAQTFSGTILGIDGMIVTVEVDISNGLPQFDVVGLGGSAVKEARDRVRAALRNSGFEFPMQRITVNLAPADLRKEGSGFDLSIALGILLASKQIPPREKKTVILGEIALDGTLLPIPGVLPILLEATKQGFTDVVIPIHNESEARLVNATILPASTLHEAVQLWKGDQPTSQPTVHHDNLPHSPHIFIEDTHHQKVSQEQRTTQDFADVCGQALVKRGLEVAAAGFHNVLLIGPPGSGKTMLATCMPSIMPEMSNDEAYETTKIYSIAGHLTRKSGLIRERPFRAPHHTITQAALIGGGAHNPRPGECSLAHSGILFLDEMPEFPRSVLEVLRQPLESGKVAIGRVKQVYSYPAQFLLIGSMNPCPCGYYGSANQQQCTCHPSHVQRYRSRISGPLLDRIDIQLEVPRVSIELLGDRKEEEASVSIKKRVENARLLQLQRFSHGKELPFNSRMSSGEIRRFIQLDQEAKRMLKVAFETMGLSARAYDRILKVARTIADLSASDQVVAAHVAEAIRYRALDRNLIKKELG